MSARAQALARRQLDLVRRSGELRHAFAQDAQALQRPLALADQVHAAWCWLRAHPEVPLAAAAVLVVLRPRRALRLAWRVWTGWRLWQKLQRQTLPLGLMRRR